MFLHIIRFSKNIKVTITVDMLDHFPSGILREDVLGGLVGQCCSRAKYGIMNYLINCSGNIDIYLAILPMKVLHHRR